MKITKVYTKTGDDGTTSLVGGVRINKSDVRLEAYGTVDELNSQLGLLAAYMYEAVRDSEKNVKTPVDTSSGLADAACESPSDALQDDIRTVERIQNNLFCVGTNLATDLSKTPLYPSAVLPEGEVEFLEAEIDRTIALLPADVQGFILPGGTLAAATAHVCRTVCRRAERNVVALSLAAEISPEVMRYLNRISDYMFVLAKKLNFVAGKSEKTWHNHCD